MNSATTALVLVLAVLSLGVRECHGERYYVDPEDGSSASDSCSEADPCKTIKEAVAKAQYGGDEISLASGIYTGSDNCEFTFDKALNFLAQDDSDLPVINLNGSWFGKWSTDYLSDTIQIASFTNIKFEGGSGDGYDPSVFQVVGGSSLTFSGCTFSASKAQNGSAVVIGSHDEDLSNEVPTLVTFLNCKFSGNTANDGGAVKVYKGNMRGVVVHGCDFDTNIANGNGGAIFSAQNVALYVSNCNFNSNTAQGAGGAIYADETDIPTQISVTSSQFISNEAVGMGGGIAALGGTLVLENATFQENSVNTGAGSQYGGGVYSSGVILSTNSTFRSNSCPVQATTARHQSGGAIYITGSSSSFIRGSTFGSNSCFYGSDFASESGTTTIIDGSGFNSDEYNDGDFQIFTKGTARFHNCNFHTSGDSDLIRSVAVQDGGLMTLAYNDPPEEISIEALFLEESTFQAPSKLVIKDIGSSWGTIESTSSFHQLLDATILDVREGTTVVSGFDVVVYQNLINSGGLVLSDSLTNLGAASFLSDSFIRSLGSSILFKNEGQLEVSGALFTCDFANAANGSIKLPQFSAQSVPMVIEGSASLLGTLTVDLNDKGTDAFDSRALIALISYTSVDSSRFSTISSSVPNPIYVYGETALTMQQAHGQSAPTFALIALALVCFLGFGTFCFCYFVLRPRNNELAQAYQVEEGGASSDGGYGAV